MQRSDVANAIGGRLQIVNAAHHDKWVSWSIVELNLVYTAKHWRGRRRSAVRGEAFLSGGLLVEILAVDVQLDAFVYIHRRFGKVEC